MSSHITRQNAIMTILFLFIIVLYKCKICCTNAKCAVQMQNELAERHLRLLLCSYNEVVASIRPYDLLEEAKL